MQAPMSSAQRQQRLFGLDTAKAGAKGPGTPGVQARGLGVSNAQDREPLAHKAAALLQAIAKEHLSRPPSTTPGADSFAALSCLPR